MVPGAQNQGTSASQSLNDFYDHFRDIFIDTIDYINDHFLKINI